MSVESTLFSLIQMDDSKIVFILRSAMKAYGKILHAIANDIYNQNKDSFEKINKTYK